MAITRRNLLKIGATAAGGLLVSVSFPSCRRSAAGPPVQLNAFVRIDRDSRTTVTVPRPEMGQGVRTSLAMLVAEELDVEWSTVAVEQADFDPKRYGEQYTGGSNSTPESWDPLRKAGAAARAVLVAAAAREWKVDPARCRTEAGYVIDDRGRRRPYSELLEAASALRAPKDPPLKDSRSFRIVGKAQRQVDVPAIAAGRARFGLDVRVPGQLYAAVAHAPMFGATVVSVDDKRARAVAGVRHVIVLNQAGPPVFEQNNPKPPSGVAVVATSTWAAFEGVRALDVRWSDSPAAAESTDAMRAAALALLAKVPERVKAEIGDFDRALAGAAKTLDVTYDVPLVAHATMEPMNCTASVRDGRCEIWAPTQNPEGLSSVAQKVTGLTPAAITIHPMRMGGGFGRRFYSDTAAQAIELAMKCGSPVQVVWTREDDLRYDFHRPASVHRLRGGIDSSGRPVAWSQFLANAARGAFLRWEAPAGLSPLLPAAEIGRFDFPVGVVENIRFEGSALASSIPLGQWRAIEDSTNVFVQQAFLDELAFLAGKDPVDYQLALLEPPRLIPYDTDPQYAWSTGRLAAVLRLAAQKSGWGTAMPPRQGRGIAAAFANEAYVAHVAEVEVGSEGAVRVLRVVSAVDCGRVINPSGARAQVEGSIVYGLGPTLHHEITVRNGAVVESNFHQFRLPAMRDMPRVEVHFIEGDERPLGLGEPALPPIAPAVTNAIFAATGKRVRHLPVRGADLI